MLKINSQFKIKEIKLVNCLEYLIKKKCLKFKVKLNKMNTGCIQELEFYFIFLFLFILSGEMKDFIYLDL